jgi:hypothetical protein
VGAFELLGQGFFNEHRDTWFVVSDSQKMALPANTKFAAIKAANISSVFFMMI